MIEKNTVCIRKLAQTPAEQKRFERMIKHEDVSLHRLIKAEKLRVNEVATGRHVLGIQDTTEFNYQSHSGRVHGLGTVGNGKDAGFFMHPLLVLDAEDGACLGAADVLLWNRLKKADEHYPQLPIEEKESYRWIESASEGRKALSNASLVTFIGDRESDIYEYYDRIPNENTHIIARVRVDRVIQGSTSKKLYAHLDNTEVSGELIIDVPREIRKGREKRKATLSIKYSQVELTRPKKCVDKGAKKTVTMYVVEAKEINCPSGQTPIHWRLYTTHKVDCFEKAQQIILWYRMRWNIEQIFRTMKSKGLDLESSQIECGSNLMKLAMFALCAAIQIMQLVLAREGTTHQKTKDLFSKKEQSFLLILLKTLEGKTLKQKNPYSQDNLAWASWTIARLGGWKGYTKSEGLPGPIVIGRGRERFYQMFDGWNLCGFVSAQ